MHIHTCTCTLYLYENELNVHVRVHACISSDLVAAVLEEADQQHCHDDNDGYEDSRVDQGKTKRLNTTGGSALVKGKVVAE